jgi:Na+/H+ antiporter NhaC
VRNTRQNADFTGGTFGRGWLEGVRSMFPAVRILLLAWVLGSFVGTLGTGEYLGGLVEGSSLPAGWLVPILFVLAAVMAFATGASWGSFGLLLPIAGGIVNVTHAVTQLPYAGVAAVAALLGYVAVALGGGVLVGLLVVLAALAAFVVAATLWRTPVTAVEQPDEAELALAARR